MLEISSRMVEGLLNFGLLNFTIFLRRIQRGTLIIRKKLEFAYFNSFGEKSDIFSPWVIFGMKLD